MVDKIKNSKALDIFELVFKVLYLFHVVLAFNALYNISNWLKVTSAISLALGSVVMLLRLVYLKEYIKRKDVWIIVLFFVSYIISMVANRGYGLSANAKCLAWMSLCFVALYLVKPNKSMKSLKFDFAVIGNIFILIMTVQGVICNYMFFTQYNRRIITPTANKAIGFYLNRLMGLYDDTNQGAVNSAMCIIIALYLIPRVKNIFARIWYVLAIFVMGMFIVLSVSRTALIGVTVGVFVYIFFATIVKADAKNFKTYRKAAIFAILAAGGIMVLYGPAKRQLANISNRILEIKQEREAAKKENEPDIDDVIDDNPIIIVEEIVHVSLERDDVNIDFSNHRGDIWKWGVKHYIKRPVLGYGKFGFVPYVIEHEPNHWEESREVSTIEAGHNIVVDVMVAQGTVGLLIFLVWMGMSICILVKYFRFIDKEHQGFATLAFSLLMLNLISSLIMPAVLYINSATAYMAWFTLGILMYMMKDAKTNYDNATEDERKWPNPIKIAIETYGMANCLFVTGFVMYMTATLASLTGPLFNTEGMWGYIRKLNSLLRYGSYGVLLLKLLYDAYKNKRQIISLAISVSLIGIAFMGHMDKTLAFYVLIILAAYGIASETVIKSAVIVQAVITGTTVLLSQLGTIQDYVVTNWDGSRPRHFVGFGYATYAPMLFLFIVLGYIYLNKGKISIFESICGLAINIYIYKLTDTRSAFLITFIAILFFLVYTHCKNLLRVTCKYMAAAPFMLCAFSMIIYGGYSSESKIYTIANDYMTGRLELGNKAIDEYGIHFWNSGIELHGYDLLTTSSDTNFVDCDYLRITVCYGWVITLAIIVGYTYMVVVFYKNEEYPAIYVVLFILVLAITEPRLMNLTFNPFLILVLTNNNKVRRKI